MSKYCGDDPYLINKLETTIDSPFCECEILETADDYEIYRVEINGQRFRLQLDSNGEYLQHIMEDSPFLSPSKML